VCEGAAIDLGVFEVAWVEGCSRGTLVSSVGVSFVGEGAAIDIGLLEGARDAGCSCGPLISSVGVPRVGEGAAMDIGRLPRGVGLCCHFMVFEREGIKSLGEGLGAESDMSAVGRARLGVDGALPRLIDPKPLNSGTTSIEEFRWVGCSFCAMLAIEAEL
jgi:hypothetical protein